MSWSLFKTKCMVLTGNTHVSTNQFAQTIADAYHQAISLHFETMTAGGKIINNAPKVIPLYQGILSVCTANMGTYSNVNFIQQISPHIITYWTGIIIQGPTGIVTVLNPGSFVGIPVVQNYNFNIQLESMITSFRTHLMTLAGTYVSTVMVPPPTTPWSGATLISLP